MEAGVYSVWQTERKALIWWIPKRARGARADTKIGLRPTSIAFAVPGAKHKLY